MIKMRVALEQKLDDGQSKPERFDVLFDERRVLPGRDIDQDCIVIVCD